MNKLFLISIILFLFSCTSNKINPEFKNAYSYFCDSSDYFTQLKNEPTFKIAPVSEAKYKVVPNGFIFRSKYTYYDNFGTFHTMSFQGRMIKKGTSWEVLIGSYGNSIDFEGKIIQF